MKYFYAIFITVIISINLCGCSNRDLPHPLAKLRSKFLRLKGVYTVEKGDTLCAIASKVEMNYKQLAKINSLKHPYTIRPGQKLVIVQKKYRNVKEKSPKKVIRVHHTYPKRIAQNNTNNSTNKKHLASRKNKLPKKRNDLHKRKITSNPKTKNHLHRARVGKSKKLNKVAQANTRIKKSNKRRYATTRNNIKTNNSFKQKTKNSKITAFASKMKWGWPAKGKIVDSFYSKDSKFRGINIAAKEGVPILSAASGRVVYSGSALRGYGNLIIIKHNKHYLSAYAHNKINLVKEGDKVKVGQQIALMGKTGTTKPKLHFEIRYNGKPIDPVKMLPRK